MQPGLCFKEGSMQTTMTGFQFRNGVFPLFLSLLLLLFVPGGKSLAAEMDSLRVGGDYKFLTLREGADFQECRRACKNDVSCKAWTFIKERVERRDGLNINLGPDLNIGFGGRKKIIPPQCRLKHTVGVKRSNECCISGVKRVVESRRPRKAELCADYAEKAVEQQDRNLSQRCRYRGSRWSGNYRAHYRWCMDTSRRNRIRETEIRADLLRQCRRDRPVRNRRCDRYAATAMDILQQARENDCRSSDSGWDDDVERIYEWCMDTRPARRKAVMERAQAKLAACIRRGGGVRIERCENYAEEALAQIARARKNRCGFSGPLWRNSFRTQYQFCRKNNRRETRRAIKRRDASINRCIRRASEARVLETGRVDVRQRNPRQWHVVRFNKRFKDPVVIMGPVSFNGSDPAHARVRRVTPRGFEFRIEEFGKDGTHVRETLSYMVVEKGIHRLNGMTIEAGTILTGADLVKREWSPVRLFANWRERPVVLAQTQTFKGSDPVNTRVRNVTRRGFDVTLSEQESDRNGHTRELVAFVAMSQGRHRVENGPDESVMLWSGRVSRANDKWLNVRFPRRFVGEVPALFALAQSSNGADTFDIRYRALDQRRVQMRLQEEQSRDRETRHTNEVLGVVALPYGGYWATSSRPVEEQVADDGPVVPLPPVGSDIDLLNCRDYSERAVNQFRRARRNACGFAGQTWHGNEERHRRWCRRNGLGAASDVLERHRRQLRQCREQADVPRPGNEIIKVNWRRMGGRLKHVSAGAGGIVWGVGRDGKVWELRRGRWREKRGRVKQLDVGNAGEIWAVGNNDRIYRWSGRRGWKKVGGRLKQISVGADGAIWGTNANDWIYYRRGSKWVGVRGRLKQVSVGDSSNIWGVNAANDVFRWTSPGWQKLPGKMKQVSVAANGDVLAVSPDNEIFRWNSRRDDWDQLSGSMKQISAGNGRRIWGVNARDRVFRADIR